MQKKIEELSESDRFLLERLNREKAKLRILQEISFSIQVCKLEGWDKMEFINDLKNMINSIGQNIQTNEIL